MDVPIGESWQPFITAAIETGRYASAGDVVAAGLRLVQAEEIKFKELRESIDAAIAEDVWYTDEEVEAALNARLDALFSDRDER